MQFNYKPLLFRCICTLSLLVTAGASAAQAPVETVVPWQSAGKSDPERSAHKPSGAAPEGKTALSGLLPELLNTDTVPMVLAKFTPPVTEERVVNSDYLLLDAPQIALAGPVSVRVLSEIPGSDLFLLFNAKPRANEPSLLSASMIPPLTRAETRMTVKLTATTKLLLISRANGLWYKVLSEVKIAEKDRK